MSFINCLFIYHFHIHLFKIHYIQTITLKSYIFNNYQCLTRITLFNSKFRDHKASMTSKVHKINKVSVQQLKILKFNILK